MKQIIISLLFICMVKTGYSQDLSFNVHATYLHKVYKDQLSKAKTLNNISADYPEGWIADYVSSEITATTNGKVLKAVGTNDILTTEQQSILQSVDMGSDIIIDVKYNHKNPATNVVEIFKVNYSVTVVPEKEAEYIGGKSNMTDYLKVNAISKIPPSVNLVTLTKSQPPLQANVKFTVNENGEVANAQLTKSSGDASIDKLLLDTLTNMPKWKPAEDANGVKVSQDFELSVGNGGC